MKRLCAALVSLVLAGGMCGCGSRMLRPVQPALPDSFACSAKITADDLQIEADWTMTHGESVFSIRAPAELSGVTVRCTQTDAAVGVDGVDAPLPETSPFVCLCSVYRILLAAAPQGEQTAQGWLYDRKQTDGFTVLQSAESGLPLRVSVPAQALTAVLTAASEPQTASGIDPEG